MSKFWTHLEQGSLFRVITGLLVSGYFAITALANRDDIYFYLFLVIIVLSGTYREFNIYMKRKNNSTSSEG